MKLPILCMSCDQHILNLDISRLSYPLHADMFESTLPNWKLPSGPVHTDIYCPICFGFPFHWDAGTGEVGKWLKIRDGNGRPQMVEVAGIIAKRPVGAPPTEYVQPEKSTRKKAIRRPTARKPRKAAMAKSEKPKSPVSIVGKVMDKVISEVEQQVLKGGGDGPGPDEPITKAEIAEVEKDRARRYSKQERPQLRAIKD